jgi:CoA:oxalate CoA-transferase
MNAPEPPCESPARQASDQATTRAPALQGIRVLDFTIVMSGPMCTRLMADAGAEVVKVESPQGDVVRQREPVLSGTSTYYASMNCGKRSIVLDLQTTEGRNLAAELAAQADVVIENFRPGVMRRLGLDYEALSKRNPRLIFASISGFGQRGPRASAPAYAPVIHAASGYESAFNSYQRDNARPANNGIFIADVMGASYAFGAIQMALFERERSGRGQAIDVSLMDSVLGMLIYEMQAAQFPPERPRQVYEPVRAKDGWVMVSAVTQKNLETLFDVIGYPEGKSDPRFATVAEKEAHWGELLRLIEGWTSERSSMDCEQSFMAAGVPCSRYRSVAEAMDDPQLKVRNFFSEIHVNQESFRVANSPAQFSATPTRARPLVADLGEHTIEVLREWLDLMPEQLQAARSSGALGGA